MTDAKYGDDKVFESFADNNIFFPCATLLIDPLHNMNLTPNMVTIISTFFTLLTIYFLYNDMKYIAISSFIFGYILDCVDGKMARKYKMGSDIGMALDSVSDVISNLCIFIFLFYKYEINTKNILLFIAIIISTYMLTISYSLNEAISTFNSNNNNNNNNDFNFYKNKYDKLTNKKDKTFIEKILFKMFLHLQKNEYVLFNKIYSKFPKETIFNSLPYVKEFGPGNYTVIICVIILLFNYKI